MFLEPIDFVLPWVDGNDPAWRAERARCLNLPEDLGELACRYRDWDLLKYMFRSLPPWLNVDHPKLHIVNHRDYIPEEYLPTFSSHPIELNAHRIPGLSDRFVLFNDDTFVLKPMPPERFFKKGLPADFAVLCPNVIKRSGVTYAAIVANDVTEINAHFTKSDVLRRNFFKYFDLRYGRALRFTLGSLAFPFIAGYWNSHFPQPYMKSTFEEVWEKDYAVLDRTCRNRARSTSDVNHWLMRYWRLAEGEFTPTRPYNRIMFRMNDKTVDNAAKTIRSQAYDLICLNDNVGLKDISEIQRKLSAAFEQILPDKSAFEK